MVDDSDLTEQVSAAAMPLPAAARQALSTVIEVLEPLSPEQQVKVLLGATAYLGIRNDEAFSRPTPARSGPLRAPESRLSSPSFSEDRTQPPKDFLREKQPVTDVDRVACLAYYLTHYRDTPHFKTLDISTLNTEAAQLKLSNPAATVENATRAGLLTPAAKGAKQISAVGEQYVQALPDRDAAKDVLAGVRTRRRNKKPRGAGAPRIGAEGQGNASRTDPEEQEEEN